MTTNNELHKGESNGDSLDNVKFEFGAHYEKAWQDEKTGKMFIRAVASDDRLDLQRDRMSGDALQKMADAAKTGVPFLETHRSVFGFGKTTNGKVVDMKDEDGKDVRKFFVEVELNGDYPQARDLFREIASGGCTKQLSIGGKLNLKNRDAVTVEMTPSGLSRTINDLALDHIASTRDKQAANPRTSFVEAIAKALDDAQDSGWQPVITEKESLATAGDTVQNAPLVMDNANDIQTGAQILANLGRLAKSGNLGGSIMNKADTPMDEETATPMAEETTPEQEKGYGNGGGVGEAGPSTPATPAEEEEEKDIRQPKQMPEQKQMTQEAKKYGQMGKGTAKAIVTEIQNLLAKMQEDEGDVAEEMTPEEKGTPMTPMDEEMTPMSPAEKSIVDTLKATRDALHKMVQGASHGDGESGSSDALPTDQSDLYAPRDSSAAKPGAKYSPDKAPAGDSTDVGSSGVSDHRQNIQIGGEIKNTAPTAKSAYSHTMADLKRSESLPQQNDNVLQQDSGDLLGKSADEQPEWLHKTFVSFEKNLLEKHLTLTQELVVAAVEKVMEEQGKSNDEVKKSVGGIGDLLNDATRRLAEVESYVEKVARAGGASQSGPRGSQDSTVQPRQNMKRGVWGGLFDKATDEALGTY
jgi:hypothetical protein